MGLVVVLAVQLSLAGFQSCWRRLSVSGDPPGHGLALIDTTYTMGSTSAFCHCDWPNNISSLSPDAVIG